MAFLDWNDGYKIGVPVIDADHRRMANVLKAFCEAADNFAAMSELSRLLADFIEESEHHFEREENLLDQLYYPQLPYHKLEHQRLMAQLHHFHGRLESGKVAPESGFDIANWLRHWLFEHIEVEDKAYRPFVMRLA